MTTDIFDEVETKTAEATALPAIGVITPVHQRISNEFVGRVVGMLQMQPFKIDRYAVSQSKGSWESNTETITVSLGEGIRIDLTLYTPGQPS